MSAVAIHEPYRYCEKLTRENAHNFYLGIRLLPRARRAAMCAVYSMARRIDDIADGPGTPEHRLAELGHVADALHDLGRPTDDPALIALDDAVTRFPIPMDAFDDLLAGARMDVTGARYQSYPELLVYCRRVAGSIGRLSLGVFGAAGMPGAERSADDLGVAMQLTNILRDVGEDLAAGRVYLPAEDLASFGCELNAAHAPPPAQFSELIRFEALRAHRWFGAGRRLLPLLDRPSAVCVVTMAETYERLLQRVEDEPCGVLDRRLRVPTWAKAWIAARALAGAAT